MFRPAGFKNPLFPLLPAESERYVRFGLRTRRRSEKKGSEGFIQQSPEAF
jgi:hypothetical protein